MKVKRLYQQGDVLVELVSGSPPQGLERKTHSLVLAEGETTGHKHLLVAEEISYGEVDGEIVFTIQGEAVITHEEHHSITLPPTKEGEVYRVRRVREYDHFAEEAKEVRD
ncbi:MAG: hypothetical protein DRH51_08460 [Candidatus Coatesbacteria bacterium]|nr:MAG: hypothetical protein DRH51_08460 [Candidatus Coatesbacteria bacterium]